MQERIIYTTASYDFFCNYCGGVIPAGEIYRKDDYEDEVGISIGVCIECGKQLRLVPKSFDPARDEFIAPKGPTPQISTVIDKPCDADGFFEHLIEELSFVRFLTVVRLGWYVFLDPSLPREVLRRIGDYGDKLVAERARALMEVWQEVRLQAERERVAPIVAHFESEEILELSAKMAIEGEVKLVKGVVEAGVKIFDDLSELENWYGLFMRHMAGESTSFRHFLSSLKLIASALGEDQGAKLTRVLAYWGGLTSRLDDRLIATAMDVNEQYMQWLSHHPKALGEIAWQAFERVVEEVFSDAGYLVEYTARCRGRSADMMAIRSTGEGKSEAYLVECKRYSSDRRVGLALVNQVLGAKLRANADFAYLVTTSTFTRDVESQAQQLEDLRLRIRDGEAIREWLRHYNVNVNDGTKLIQGWDL